ncbi:hypothetical protein BN874_720004 [Candidatus Contendobacter odensis Run_B_J11]|uniref:Uncharacterized protein n=1 Tax=Candidatus Contendobacter odensis Run_B_J11 TaxID=1400861 RepID=A0A7U7J5B6_9GAMM|nr:hypothetical protein BN874_720004 [Candidatus Contendobacter odensis Run_B_J11]
MPFVLIASLVDLIVLTAAFRENNRDAAWVRCAAGAGCGWSSDSRNLDRSGCQRIRWRYLDAAHC